MLFLRSALFNAVFFLWSAVLCFVYLPLLVLPERVMVRGGTWWSKSIIRILGLAAGTGFEIRGAENIPTGSAIFASKHQSAWDTLIYMTLLPGPALVMKRELFRIPLYGWYARHAGMIGVDRRGGARALKHLIRRARSALKGGRSVVIFPQGTRTAPGAREPYQAGVAALYRVLGQPIVPTAVNSGLYWGRRAFLKRPGTILIEVLPAIPAGLDRDDFMAELERRIETATDRLVAEGRSRAPALARQREGNPRRDR
ncbi:MAG: 1-acyl-sn-glycerol-3-phosphate acyltransferase [Proteobacteria bacterium]|nr:1-acyl-sn-glycerol-3-phosphate acyltransferase [Pseudomonadota bacterium]